MDLAIKHRPAAFDEVWGQDPLVKSLTRCVADDSAHAFLLHGPSGCGKTTLARIVAKELGCTNVVEIDAATNTGIEDMRQVATSARYSSMGGGRKMVIVDEAHGLSKKAWDSLLKIIEEPPAHLYWALCTTEPTKVPKTIQTRCLLCPVKPLSVDDLIELVEAIAEEEEIELPEGGIRLIARQADGSARRAIKLLDAAFDAETLDDVREVAGTFAGDSEEVIALCRYLAKPGASYPGALKILKTLPTNTSAEGVRHVVCGYFYKMLIDSKSAKPQGWATDVLSCFANPYPASHNLYPVALSLADLLSN